MFDQDPGHAGMRDPSNWVMEGILATILPGLGSQSWLHISCGDQDCCGDLHTVYITFVYIMYGGTGQH